MAESVNTAAMMGSKLSAAPAVLPVPAIGTAVRTAAAPDPVVPAAACAVPVGTDATNVHCTPSVPIPGQSLDHHVLGAGAFASLSLEVAAAVHHVCSSSDSELK